MQAQHDQVKTASNTQDIGETDCIFLSDVC